jgi:hypothetical protein
MTAENSPASAANISDVKEFYPNEITEISDSEKFSGFNEGERLKFAKQILLYLFILVLLVFMGSYLSIACYSTNAELVKLVYSILDITKTVVPATVTLVLGFYFGRKDT